MLILLFLCGVFNLEWENFLWYFVWVYQNSTNIIISVFHCLFDIVNISVRGGTQNKHIKNSAAKIERNLNKNNQTYAIVLLKNFLPMFGKFCLCATKPYKIHICKFLFLSFYCWLERLRGSRYHWQKLKRKHTTKEIDFCQLKNREATDTYITHTILY